MNIIYNNNKVEKVLSSGFNSNTINQYLGPQYIKPLKMIYNSFNQSPNFYVLMMMKIRKMEHLTNSKNPKEYSMHLTANYRLIFEPKIDDLSPVSLKKCQTVIVKGVVDYHGSNRTWIIP